MSAATMNDAPLARDNSRARFRDTFLFTVVRRDSIAAQWSSLQRDLRERKKDR